MLRKAWESLAISAKWERFEEFHYKLRILTKPCPVTLYEGRGVAGVAWLRLIDYEWRKRKACAFRCYQICSVPKKA